MKYDLTYDPTSDDIDCVIDGLNEHSIKQVTRSGFDEAAIFVRDADGAVRGGILAYLNWNWLEVSLLWIDDAVRDAAHGRRLMHEMEALGYAHGCRKAHVDTFSFQAKSFYESLGYAEFAALEDYPPGHTCIFLKKSLGPPDGDAG